MSKSTKTTTENKPPAWSEGLFKLGAAETERLYKSGVGGNTYMGSTVAPLSGTTMQGVNQLKQAGANWDTGGTRDIYAGIGAESVKDPFVAGLSTLAGNLGTTANKYYNPIASGQDGITTGNQYQGIVDKAGGKSAAESYLTDMASGKWLKEGNPYFNARLEGQLEDTAAQTRSLASGAGRYGSDVSNRMLTDRLGNLRTDALAQDWDRNLLAQLQTTGQIDAARSQGITNQLSALNGLTGTQSANIQNRLEAAGGLVNASAVQGGQLAQAGNLRGQGLDRAQTSANAMRDIDQQNYKNRLEGAKATLDAGNILDTQDQKLIADEVAKFYALDNQDWNRISMLLSGAAGSAGDYGIQNQTTRQPINIAGVLSGIGSLLSGKSDVRLKENIVHVGWMNGLRVFEFSYRGETARWRGVMAQDLPLSKHGALHVDDDGFYGVDYAQLGFPMTRVN